MDIKNALTRKLTLKPIAPSVVKSLFGAIKNDDALSFQAAFEPLLNDHLDPLARVTGSSKNGAQTKLVSEQSAKTKRKKSPNPEAMVKMLMRDIKNENKKSLYEAILATGSLQCLKYAVELGVDISGGLEERLRQKTPLSLLMEHHHDEAFEYLLAQGADWRVPVCQSSLPFLALEADNTGAIKRLLKAGMPPDVISQTSAASQSVLLCEAVKKKNIEFARCLVEAGADLELSIRPPNENDKDLTPEQLRLRLMHTPLLLAARTECLEMIQMLLDAGADREARGRPFRRYSTKRFSAPMFAIEECNAKALSFLLEAGFSCNDKTPDEGHSLLMQASVQEDSLCLRQLIKAGADLNQRDLYGNTALIHAIEGGPTENALLLIQAGCDVNLEGNDTWDLQLPKKRTALLAAGRMANLKVLDVLHTAGADTHYEAEDGVNFLKHVLQGLTADQSLKVLLHTADWELEITPRKKNKKSAIEVVQDWPAGHPLQQEIISLLEARALKQALRGPDHVDDSDPSFIKRKTKSL